MTDADQDEAVSGHVQCHCSEDDGVPDVGVSVGLGSGRSLWLGELLTRDGGDIGMIVHGPDGQRDVAVLWPNCQWQDAADLLRHYVGPAIAQAHAAGRAEVATYVEASEYLTSLYERLWHGGVVRDLAEAIAARDSARARIPTTGGGENG